jgi:hypothetical protein
MTAILQKFKRNLAAIMVLLTLTSCGGISCNIISISPAIISANVSLSGSGVASQSGTCAAKVSTNFNVVGSVGFSNTASGIVSYQLNGAFHQSGGACWSDPIVLIGGQFNYNPVPIPCIFFSSGYHSGTLRLSGAAVLVHSAISFQ